MVFSPRRPIPGPRSPRRRRRLPVLLIALSAGTTVSGCHKQAPAHELDFPDDGAVRIVSRQIEQTDGRVHWKWSLIGERNWVHATAKGTDLALADTYPINDPSSRGGCNIWECDLIVERAAGGDPGVSPPGDGKAGLRWTATLQGSDGVVTQSAGTLPGDARDVDSAASIRLSDDAQPRLPADVALATVGGHDLILHIAR